MYINCETLTNYILYIRGFDSESTLLNRYTTPGRVSSGVGSSRPCDRARRRYRALVSKPARVTLTQASLHSVIHDLDEAPRVGWESQPRQGSQASGNSIGSVLLPHHSFDVGGGLTGSLAGLSILTSADPTRMKLPGQPTVARFTSAPAS